jgi:hypothetical protein
MPEIETILREHLREDEFLQIEGCSVSVGHISNTLYHAVFFEDVVILKTRNSAHLSLSIELSEPFSSAAKGAAMLGGTVGEWRKIYRKDISEGIKWIQDRHAEYTRWRNGGQ